MLTLLASRLSQRALVAGAVASSAANVLVTSPFCHDQPRHLVLLEAGLVKIVAAAQEPWRDLVESVEIPRLEQTSVGVVRAATSSRTMEMLWKVHC